MITSTIGVTASLLSVKWPDFSPDGGYAIAPSVIQFVSCYCFRDVAQIPRPHPYLGLSLKAFLNDGFYPIVAHVAPAADESARPLSLQVMAALRAKEPAFEELFPGMAAFAYAEPPLEAGRSYKRFGTTVTFDPEQ